MRLIRQNVNASFAWADELAKATELEEIQQIQGRHAQLQISGFMPFRRGSLPARKTT